MELKPRFAVVRQYSKQSIGGQIARGLQKIYFYINILKDIVIKSKDVLCSRHR